MLKKMFALWKLPEPVTGPTKEIYEDLIRFACDDRDHYRKLAYYLAEMVTFYPTVYQGKTADFVLDDLARLFQSDPKLLEEHE